jgi:3',5'-cyclic-AMP phosphodiesterase
MPAIFYKPMDRRRFLDRASRTLAALALVAETRILAADAPASESAVHLALVSDTHVPADPANEYRKFFPYENLKAIVPQIIEAGPSGMIVTGDVARLMGEVADYQAVKKLLVPVAEKMPIYLGLGNHDHRENFLKVFDSKQPEVQSVSSKHVLVIEHPVVRLVILDSLLYTNQVAGLLGKTQRAWLGKYLSQTDGRPTVLFFHHTLGDGDDDLLDIDRLYQLLKPHKKVKAIFYGHSHEYSIRREQDLHLVNLPAVAYTFSDREPVGWVDAVFKSSGVTLKLKALAGNRSRDGELTTLAWNT